MPPIFAPIISVTPGFGDDTPNPIIDKIFDILEDLYENSGAQALLACEKPAHTRGWKIDWIPSSNANIKAGSIDISLRVPSIQWAPCGCYEVLDWPVLSLGLGSAAIVARKLRKKALRKTSLYIKQKFNSPIVTLRDNWNKYRNWGVRDWDKFVKLPSVPSGHKRLYRLNGSVPVVADDANGWGTGRWFTDNQEYAMRHNKFTVGATHISYVDVPTNVANDVHMGNTDSRWRKKLAESGEKMNGGRGVDADRLIDNPARFVGNPDVAKYEYFLDSDYANQATKVSQFSSLPDIKELNDAWKPMESLFDSYDAEKFLDNTEYRNTFLNEWNQATSNLKNNLGKYFDDSDFVFNWLMKGNEFSTPVEATPDGSWYRPSPAGLENLFSEDSEIIKSVVKATAFFAFINQIISVTDVVRDLNCSPIGKNSSYGLTPKDKIFIKQIRDNAIENKKTTWAELDPDTCECNECPSDWNLCDNSSITNLYSSQGNTCHPPCCGGQEWKPITLIETCKCDCPDGKVFMECDCSDCSEGSGTPVLDLITGSGGKKGICVDSNPDESRLEWNKQTCKWECKTFTNSYPPHLWGGSIKVPITPPCKPNQQREPNACECSGFYKLEPCISESSQRIFNIVPITEIRIIG
jgi:hypothetical protein